MNWDGRLITDSRYLPIADSSVQTCITSPPYWQLRSYDTGHWIGGDLGCTHKRNHGVQGQTGDRATRRFTGQSFYLWECGLCGAKREDLQIGLEPTIEEYIETMVAVFREVWRVLKPNGTTWVNLGDGYANGGCGARDPERWPKQSRNDHMPVHAKKSTGLKAKNLLGIPWKVAFALQDAGWILRSDIVWHKTQPMPESVKDRPTRAHEFIFLLVKQEEYYYDHEAIKEPASKDSHARYGKNKKIPAGWQTGLGSHSTIGHNQGPRDNKQDGHGRRHAGFNERYREAGVHPKAAAHDSGIKQNSSFSAAVKDVVDMRNKRDVWSLGTSAYPEAHYATFPPELVRPCVLAGSKPGDIVLDIFAGSNTVGMVAERFGRRWLACDLAYQHLQEKRLKNVQKELLLT